MDRRAFLQQCSLLYAGGALASLSACQGGRGAGNPSRAAPAAAPASARRLDSRLPASNPLTHLLRRTRFGTSRADYEAAQALGLDAYLEQQLNPQSLNGRAEGEAAIRFPATSAPHSLVFWGSVFSRPTVTQWLAEKTIFLGAYSERQLFEVVVDFWTNHFNVQNITGDLPASKIHDDREVIRAHSLGNFRDLLHATARSPAMLEYLDGVSNTVAGPNENYARELMELHTLGVDGGYTEADVKEVARCFTGWNLNGASKLFEFRAADHDNGEKVVLGTTLPSGRGIEDGDDVLDLLARHPSTARFVATKLVRRFVADDPPPAIVAAVEQSFIQSAGDIPSLLRTLFNHPDFYRFEDHKLKRPLEFVCGTLRAFNADPFSYPGAQTVDLLTRLGQVPHRWFPPDGYPDTADYWLSTSGLLERWNFAATTVETRGFFGNVRAASFVDAEESAGSLVDKLAAELLHRPLAAQDRRVLTDAVAEVAAEPLSGEDLNMAAELVAGLLLASPYFNLR